MKNERQILELQARFLTDLLQRPSGITTLDAVTTDDEIAGKYSDYAPYRGCAIGILSRKGTITYLTSTKSVRKARKKGRGGVWKLEDATAASAELERIKSRLEDLDPTDAPLAPSKPRYRQKRLGGGGFDDE